MLRNVFLLSLVAITLLAGTTAHLHHGALRSQQEFHGWDRAIEITSATGRPKVVLAKPSGLDFVASIMAPFNWARIISAQALENLRNSPSVESVHRVMVYTSLLDDADRPVTISVVDPGFIDAFRLGDEKKLSADLAIGASNVEQVKSVSDRYANGDVFLRGPRLTGLSAARLAEHDKLPPARQKLSSAVFTSRPMWFDGKTQFYVSPAWVDSPGRSFGTFIPSIEAVVKLRPGINTDSALSEIQAILDSAPSPLIFPGQIAHARPLLDVPGTDKTRRALLLAGHWIPVALAATLALCALAMIWLRFRALSLELALRRGFGQSKWAAAMHALRPEMVGLGMATAGACVIAWVWFAVQGHLWAAPKLWPATWLGVALGAGLSLLLARALVSRPTALLVKSQTD